MNQTKKGLISIAVFILSFYFLTSFVFAQENSKGIVTASVLNLRSGPSITYDVLGSLFKNKQITILSNSENWYKVKTYSGKVGWVSKEYISKVTSKVSRGDTVVRSASTTLSNATGLLSFAKNHLGVEYVWGGTSPNGFDCSGFVLFVYKHFGIKIDRVARDQAKEGTYVNKSDLLPGDLVFFDTDGGHELINHVGIYIGKSQFIHASSGRGEVIITDISHGFYANTYMTARRIIK